MATARRDSSPSASTRAVYSGISNYRAGSTRPALASADSSTVAKTHYKELKMSLHDYVLLETQNWRANPREKLTRLSRVQFQELSTDVYDELMRRNGNEKGGATTLFLPVRDDFHPKRNQARQKLATLATTRFKDLSSDTFYELGRRYPEFKEPDVLSEVPDAPQSGYDPPTPELVGGRGPNRQNLRDQSVESALSMEHSPNGVMRDMETGDPVSDIRPTVTIQSGQITCEEMFQHLIDHGCTDLSSNIDPGGYSSGLIQGGAFGDIWKGKLRDGTEVAIKVWRFSSVSQEDAKPMKRAMREIYHWSKAKHENIQELMGVIMFQGRLGMVSVWMEQGNLRDYVRRNPNADHFSLCIQVAAGLSYLHDQNMVHGDLKAANILVSQDCVAKICDFDHSILSECTLMFSDTTNAGGGTLRWMAPELLLSSEEGDGSPARRNKQSDVYALGMVSWPLVYLVGAYYL